jgi:WD40 repeat protein
LFAFREEDADYFYGREASTEQIVAASRRQPLVAVIGPSGSGKTSVVQAGVVASLRPEAGWLIASFRPGSRPFQALAGSLIDLLEPSRSETERLLEMNRLAGALATGEVTLQEVVERIVDRHETDDGPPPRLLLVADQFEELYTLGADSAARRNFLDLLLNFISEQQFRRRLLCTVVMTLRADFLGQVLSYRPLADALHEADVKLGPMTRAELKRAIVQPARKQGVDFAPGLVPRILDDVEAAPGNLPLLAFALDTLWQQGKEGLLTHEAYESIGKVEGALAHYADSVLDDLEAKEQAIARRIFIQLVHPGEGTEDTRRLATREELGTAAWPLVQRLADSRLLVTGRDEAGRQTVEMAHEALMRGWDRFRQWVEHDRAFRLWQEQLRAAMQGWMAHDRDEGALLRGVALATAEDWLQRRPDDLSAAERDYINASLRFRERRRTEEERSRAERERLRRTRTGILAGGLLVTAVLALLAGILWWRAERQRQGLAEAQEAVLQERDVARQALSRRLAVEAQNRVTENPTLAVLLALENWRRSGSEVAYEALTTVLARSRRLLARESLMEGPLYTVAIAISPDGRLLAMGEDGSAIGLWAVDSFPFHLERLATLKTGSDVYLRGLAFGPDGEMLAASQLDGVSLFDLSDLTRPTKERLPGLQREEPVPTRPIAFSPDGESLAIAVGEGVVQLWNLAAQQPRERLQAAMETPFNALAFTPDGERLVAGGDGGNLVVWELESGESRGTNLEGDIADIAVSPGGEQVAVGGEGGSAGIWQLDPLEPLAAATGDEAPTTNDVAFTGDGRLISAGADGRLVMWRRVGAELIPEPLRSEPGAARAIAIHGPARWMAAAGLDGHVSFWNTETAPTKGFRLEGHANAVHALAFDGDGTLLSLGCDHWVAGPLVTAATPPCTQVEMGSWQLAGRPAVQDLFAPEQHPAAITSLALNADGIAGIAYDDGSVALWDIGHRQKRDNLSVPETEPVTGLAFDPTSNLVATGGCFEHGPSKCPGGRAHLWNLEQPRRPQRAFSAMSGIPMYLTFSPDGRWLGAFVRNRAGDVSDQLVVWNLDGEEPRRYQRSVFYSGLSLAFHPPDNLLARGTNNGRIYVGSLPTMEDEEVVTKFDAQVLSVAISPNGRLLAMAGCAVYAELAPQIPECRAQLEVLDLETGRLLPRSFAGHTRAPLSLAFSPDGSVLASGDFAGDIILWDMSATGADNACRQVGRNMTAAEWERYFGAEPYRPTCPDLPAAAAER